MHRSPCLPLSTLLKNLRESVIEMRENHKLIVRRQYIFQDALTAFQVGFNWKKQIFVTFFGEPVIDAGGPCREYFRLLIRDTLKSSFFEGAEDARVPTQNMVALEKQTYKHMGKLLTLNRKQHAGKHTHAQCFSLMNSGQMMAVSIVNGGPGPQCFSKAVADCICYGMPKVRATIADVPDGIVQQQLRLVCEFIIIIV